MSRVWLAAIALASIFAIAAALVSQHAFNMQPCPWCALQRLVFAAIALMAVLALVWRPLALGVLLLAACGIGAALWQHFVAAASASCNLTFADKLLLALKLPQTLPDVFEPRASCAEAAVRLLGVPYEFWSLALYVLIVLIVLMAVMSLRAVQTR